MAVRKYDLRGAVDISMAVKSILIDPNLKELLVRKGTEMAKGFTWDKCARETLEVLRNTKNSSYFIKVY